MTQIFKEDGSVVPVTILNVGSSVVAGIKSTDKDGYSAVMVGFGKKKNPSKAENGKFKTLGFVPMYIREFVIDDMAGIEVGSEIKLDTLKIGDYVDVSGVTKGKGFQGVVKRYGFHGGPATHGQSDRHRAPGSIGQGTTPGRVYKGKRMPGHMGNVSMTVKNLEVVGIDLDEKLILVKGAVPGNKGGILKIKVAKVK